MKTIFAVLLIVALAGCSFADSVTVTATMAMEPSAMQPSSTASAGSQCMEGQYCLFIFKDENAASTEGTNATCGTATYVSESPILLNTPCFPINTASDNVTKVWAVVNTTNATIDGANVTQYDGALYTDSTCSGTALPFGCSETCTNQTCLDSCMTDTCVQLPVAGWAYYLASDYSRIPEGTVPSSVIPSGGASATQTMMATATATVMPTDVVATATVVPTTV